MKYRSEIDGLRAIAVLSVTLFHFFPITLTSGFRGYLGVDIFFVISGFLISKYIYTSLESNSFSFKEFYWRRIKRILPAAFFTLLLTSIFSFFVLTTNDLSTYFKSQLSALTFVPNIFFWRTGGYFGGLDALKPLLHFWSLGVEEQFYLFFPLTLYLSYKVLGQHSVLYAVFVISLLSLFLNIFIIKIGGSNPAFFLLPTRVWEFGIGCMGAILAENNKYTLKPFLTNLLLIGLLCSLFLLLPEPIPHGFLPSLLTGLMLFYFHSGGTALNILSNNISTFFGKISFSLYLIHWPVIVFLGYYFIDDIPLYYLILALFLTILFSFFSYKLIEIPFRHQLSALVVKRTLLSLFLVIGTTSLIGINTNILNVNNSQLVSNLSDQIDTNYRCPVLSFRSFGPSRACVINGEYNLEETKIVLLGNSHAQMYTPLIQNQTKNIDSILVPLNGCLPTTEIGVFFQREGYSQKCLEWANDNKVEISQLPSLRTLIIGMTWYEESYFSKKGKSTKKDMVLDLIDLIDFYEGLGVVVYVISPIPIPYFNHASDLSRKLKFGFIDEKEYLNLSKIDFPDFYLDISIYDKLLEERLKDNYIKAYEKLCDKQYCYYGDLGGSFFSDDNHLSKYGISKMADLFNKIEL